MLEVLENEIEREVDFVKEFDFTQDTLSDKIARLILEDLEEEE